ncbi:uncharacterized protein OCT59_011291 [Rhizophagus irregularis]|uniref:uncharacterized protein n=1 Tax=Rhizophagus irregularis TaxID=588596 RepID=UPI00332AE408|nr:hypothetical protein OCT59_011291 [Rhizophagus irregularis]
MSTFNLTPTIARDEKKLKDDPGPWTQLDHLVVLPAVNSSDVNSRLIHSVDITNLHSLMSLVEKRIEIDGKYDLNLDRTPVLSIVTENSVGCGLPIAFALCRYPIALVFKIVGRCRTEESAIEMTKQYIYYY